MGRHRPRCGRAEQAARDGRALDDDPDLLDAFFHDVPPDVTAAAMARGEPAQSSTAFTQPWPLKAWPEVPTRILQGRDDRFFPVDFQRRVVQDRLGITANPRNSQAAWRGTAPSANSHRGF